MSWADAQPATSDSASSRDTPAASSDQATSSGPWPQLPKPTAKSQQRGRDATPQAATTRQKKGGANKSGEAPEPLSWGDIFKSPDDYLRPLRAVCQDDGTSVPLASAARGSETAVELFGPARPPLQARANAYPQGEKQFKLDLSWHGIDRDLWPLSSWNKSLGETGPRPRHNAKGRGKERDALREEAIWQLEKHQEVDQLTEQDRAVVCRPAGASRYHACRLARYRALASGLLHRLRRRYHPHRYWTLG